MLTASLPACSKGLNMGEEIQEWQHLWGAKVHMPIDVPDDILKNGIQTVHAKLQVRSTLLHPCKCRSPHPISHPIPRYWRPLLVF